jgi:hypothetical protein
MIGSDLGGDVIRSQQRTCQTHALPSFLKPIATPLVGGKIKFAGTCVALSFMMVGQMWGMGQLMVRANIQNREKLLGRANELALLRLLTAFRVCRIFLGFPFFPRLLTAHLYSHAQAGPPQK